MFIEIRRIKKSFGQAESRVEVLKGIDLDALTKISRQLMVSMAKILGYTDGEIARLYMLPTLFVTVFFLIASLPVEYGVMVYIFRVVMMTSISRWIPLYVDPVIYVKMFFLGFAACGAVSALEYRRVGRVPMGEALKNVE